jgi:D-3-phosphoglycerate dehydrogenase / 2-oxoglutarate reductase
MKIKILHKNKAAVSNYFQAPKYQVAQTDAAVELIISGATTDLNKEQLSKFPSLKFIIHCCNGINTIDTEYCKQQNITIFNSPTANINATAEHTTALILSSLRKIPQADQSMREGFWRRDQFLAKEINQCTIGFIGFGKIARIVNQKLSSFNPKQILAYDPFLTQEQITNSAKNVTKVDLEQLFKEADIISLHLPLLDSTRNMISEPQFNLMKQDCVIINCSRGGIIDETALIKFLNNNQLATAALDVFENEPNNNSQLFQLPNIILTPHIASMSKKAQEAMVTEAKENFEAQILNSSK